MNSSTGPRASRTGAVPMSKEGQVTMTNSNRPMIPVGNKAKTGREVAREYADARAGQIRQAYGFVILRRRDEPSPAYGIHEIKGLDVVRGPSSNVIRYARFRAQVVGLVSPLVADEFASRMRFEQPLTSTLQWKHMSPLLRDLVAASDILPHEWKNEKTLSGDFLDSRVRIIANTPILQFLSV